RGIGKQRIEVLHVRLAGRSGEHKRSTDKRPKASTVRPLPRAATFNSGLNGPDLHSFVQLPSGTTAPPLRAEARQASRMRCVSSAACGQNGSGLPERARLAKLRTRFVSCESG